MNTLIKHIIHLFFQSHKVQIAIKDFAKSVHNKKILEIGSGPNPSKKYFDDSNEFIMSDLSPSLPGCLKIDLSKMKYEDIFDVVISINVLDDIYDYQKAVNNIYRSLKKGGKCFLIVNGLYPLHDLPHDYWRFTPYSLSKIFSHFSKVKINTIGISKFPSYYTLIATK